MSEWVMATLGDMIELKRGYDLPQKSRARGSVPLVSSSGISDYHSEHKVRGPGVVTGRYGTIGQVYFVQEDFWPLNTTLYVRDFKGNDPRFVSYFLSGLDFLAYSDKAAVPGLNRNHLHTAKVRYPKSAAMQNAIASVLSALDDKIELNRQMNSTLEETARALFRDWFVDFGPTRAMMDGCEPYLAPELWSLFPDQIDEATGHPKGWKSESIYDQADWINGAAYKNMHFSEAADALPVVKIAELKAGVTAQTKRTNTALGDKYLIGNGELLFSWSGNPDTSIDVFVWTNGAAWLNQHIFAVRENGKRDRVFLYFMLKSFMSEFAEIARDKQTTGLGHVTKADLQRLTLCVGTREICQEYSRCAGPLLDRMISNQLEMRELIDTRDYLLPKLISGEITVRDAEKQIEEAA